MSTPTPPFYLLADMLADVQALHHHLLIDTLTTPEALALVDRLRQYMLADEDLKNRMLTQHAQTIADYETRLAQIQQIQLQ